MSKVWFITGAGSGLGTGIARAALGAGDRVVATGRNLEKVRKAYPDAAQENIAFVQLDVSDRGAAAGGTCSRDAVQVHGWFVLRKADKHFVMNTWSTKSVGLTISRSDTAG